MATYRSRFNHATADELACRASPACRLHHVCSSAREAASPSCRKIKLRDLSHLQPKHSSLTSLFVLACPSLARFKCSARSRNRPRSPVSWTIAASRTKRGEALGGDAERRAVYYIIYLPTLLASTSAPATYWKSSIGTSASKVALAFHRKLVGAPLIYPKGVARSCLQPAHLHVVTLSSFRQFAKLYGPNGIASGSKSVPRSTPALRASQDAALLHLAEWALRKFAPSLFTASPITEGGHATCRYHSRR